MRARTLFAILAGLSLAAGCNQTTSPIFPVPSTPSAPPAAISALAISNVAIAVVPPAKPGDPFYYNETFLLTETSGRSGATVLSVESSADRAERDITGAACWRNTIRVEPGGTLDVFQTGRDSIGPLSYCAPFAASPTPASSVSIVVTFSDDAGRTGTVQATATVARQQ
jgi:hypothetical protein